MEPEAITGISTASSRLRGPHVVRQGHAHGAHFVDGLVMVPAGHVDHRTPSGLEAPAELDGLLDGVSVGLVVGPAHPHADGMAQRPDLPLASAITSSRKRMRFSRLPPYQSVRLLVLGERKFEMR